MTAIAHFNDTVELMRYERKICTQRGRQQCFQPEVAYLSTILDDYSRYIVSWKLCTNMRAENVTATLELALQAGCDQVHVVRKPRLLSNNESRQTRRTEQRDEDSA